MPRSGTDQRDRPVVEAERRVGDQQIGVEGVARAEAVAIGAHAVRAVEAEQLRAGRLVALVAMGAGVVGGEEDVVMSGELGRRSADFDGLCALPSQVRLRRPTLRPRSTGDDHRCPSPSASACSTASARRGRTFGSILQPVDDDLDVVLDRRSSFRSSVRRTTWPSTRARTKPRLSMSSNRSLYSPFCPRTTGARTRKRVPSGRARMRAMICSRVWAVMGRPHCGQWPWPTRA